MKFLVCVVFLVAAANASYLPFGWNSGYSSDISYSSPISYSAPISYSSYIPSYYSGWSGLSSGWSYESTPIISTSVYDSTPYFYKSAPIYSAPIVVKKYVSTSDSGWW